MKTEIYLICIFGVALLTSCHNDPSEEDMQRYLTALRPYYPYSLDKDMTFVNDSINRTWIVKHYDYNSDGKYPETHITICNREANSNCSGDRSLSISAILMDASLSKQWAFSEQTTLINYTGYQPYASSVDIMWGIELCINKDEFFRGYLPRITCSPEEVLSYLTDTITIPITQQQLEYSVVDAPQGAYARIVKGKGLTDFSIDGTTIWSCARE